jgi:chromate transporter
MPSFVLVAKTSHLIDRHKESTIVKGMFSGLRPVVVGLIASAAMLLMNSANFGTETYDVCWSIALCVASFCTVYFTKIHPIAVIFIAAIAGYIIF